MSTYRTVERARHGDERVMAVGPIARAVWDYLICNEQDHASGLYRLSLARASEDTGWTAEQLEEALGELEHERLIQRDARLRLVWVVNMLRKAYRNPTSKQLKSVETHLASMPRSPLVARMVAYYADRYGLRIPFETHSDGFIGVAESPKDGAPPPLGPPPEGSLSVSDRIGIGSVSESESRRFVSSACGAPPPHTASSGELHELDIRRRTIEREEGREVGPLSQNAEVQTLEGLRRAMTDVGWREVVEVFEFAVRTACRDRAQEKFYRRMFRGDGFYAWRERHEADKRQREKLHEQLAPTPEGPRLDPTQLDSVLADAEFMRTGAR